MSDLDLLQQYARTNSQDAFTALVQRHVHLVYSAARRQVRSPQLAEEVTQSVFIDLARQGGRLDPAQPLAAWLSVVTRRTAVDVIRRESRRQAREQAAAEIAAMKTPPSSWSRISEVLDEAMESLDEADRSALLLRFFENRSLREVGAALRLSEDAAPLPRSAASPASVSANCSNPPSAPSPRRPAANSPPTSASSPPISTRRPKRRCSNATR